MEKQNESMRDRLLARLPQPENLTAYRKETAFLLAKHDKALSWERWSCRILSYSAMALWFMCISGWGQRLDHRAVLGLWSGFGLMLIGAMSTGLSYYINRSKVDLLKEVKQVQLQVLELQASLQKNGGHNL
jgi:hypothetical protein